MGVSLRPGTATRCSYGRSTITRAHYCARYRCPWLNRIGYPTSVGEQRSDNSEFDPWRALLLIQPARCGPAENQHRACRRELLPDRVDGNRLQLVAAESRP